MWPDCASHPEGLALVRAAAAHPLEQTPRLILADWLQEQGEEGVAGIIRRSMKLPWEFMSLPHDVEERWKPINGCQNGWLAARWSMDMSQLTEFPISAWVTALEADLILANKLKELAPLINLTTLDFRGSRVTDENLEELASFPHLSTLTFYSFGMTGERWKKVAKLLPLTTLHLWAGDDVIIRSQELTGLKELAALPNLTKLDLRYARVTDTHLKEITTLKHLTALNLQSSSITDAGIQELTALHNLTSLILMGTEVTTEGARELQKALPHCEISK